LINVKLICFFFQDVTDVLIRYCNAKFFSLPLSGSTLMMLDFIHGAKMVLAQPTDIRNVMHLFF